ncbi:hypothetical protein KOW79_003173 [Hemibagrus wyckioides]|uniref:Uncharacterized protein n=1 Tax=Hemibagrus wyckioides TaxID=337641 RepID=A0A9D3P1R0_9TELE|nr:hypothetical protein KOW79_003173 [Hemibagrus wyckioides]
MPVHHIVLHTHSHIGRLFGLPSSCHISLPYVLDWIREPLTSGSPYQVAVYTAHTVTLQHGLLINNEYFSDLSTMQSHRMSIKIQHSCLRLDDVMNMIMYL